MQVYSPRLVIFARTDSTTSKAYIYTYTSWYSFWWSPFLIRGSVYSFQLYWCCTTYICFSGNVLKIAVPKNLIFFNKIPFRVFEEFWHAYTYYADFIIYFWWCYIQVVSLFLKFYQTVHGGVSFLLSDRGFFCSLQLFKTLNHQYEYFR